MPAFLVQVMVGDEVDNKDLQLAYLGRVRRLSRANQICVALCLTIVTMLGLMAGMQVYRSLFTRRQVG